MPSLALSLITVDRSPRRNYLGQTLQSLAAGGIRNTSVPWSLDIVDSGSTDSFFETEGVPEWLRDPRVRLHRPSDGESRGPNANAAEALRQAAGRQADWVLFLEDDILVCAHFLDSVSGWLDDHSSESHRVVAFGAAYRELIALREAGRARWEYPISAFYGTQCIALRTHDAADVATYWQHEDRQCLYDLLLKYWARERYPAHEYFAASVPSFVQHVGRDSAIHYGRFHEFAAWAGSDWSYCRPIH